MWSRMFFETEKTINNPKNRYLSFFTLHDGSNLTLCGCKSNIASINTTFLSIMGLCNFICFDRSITSFSDSIKYTLCYQHVRLNG